MEGIVYKMPVAYIEVDGKRNEHQVYEVCVEYKGCEGVARFDHEFEYIWGGVEWEDEVPTDWDEVEEHVKTWAIEHKGDFI